MSSYYPAKKKAPESYTTEFDILKASHKFLRSHDEDVSASWNAQLAKKYEDSLYKEFAVCDLKHFKSGNIALRWRTEDEVLSGAGEETCGNTRCVHYGVSHQNDARPSNMQDAPPKSPKLTTLELPFSYVERGETEVREVLVKVVLCERCVKKLMWQKERSKKQHAETTGRTSPGPSTAKIPERQSTTTEPADNRHEKSREQTRKERISGRRSNSRSRSPRYRER